MANSVKDSNPGTFCFVERMQTFSVLTAQEQCSCYTNIHFVGFQEQALPFWFLLEKKVVMWIPLPSPGPSFSGARQTALRSNV